MLPPARPSTRRLLLGATIACLLGLSGCVGSGGPISPTAPTATGGEEPLPTNAAGDVLALFPTAPVDTTVWANGSFQPQEHFFPLGFVASQAGIEPTGIRYADITQRVPKGVPTVVTAEVNAQVTEGDVDLWVETPFEESWSGIWDTPNGGYSKIIYRFIHENDDPIRIGLFYDELDPQAEVPYTLRVDVRSDPSLLVEAVGAKLEVPHMNATLVVTPLGGRGDRTLSIWGPDLELLLRHDLKAGPNELRLEEEGEHILLLSDGAGDATVAVRGPAEPARLLPAYQEIIEERLSSPGPSAEWSFHADRIPIQVAMMAQSPTVATDYTGSLAGPKGPLLASTFTGGPWVRPLMAFGIGEWTPMGDPRLAAGDYTAQARFAQAAGPDPIRHGHFLVFITSEPPS